VPAARSALEGARVQIDQRQQVVAIEAVGVPVPYTALILVYGADVAVYPCNEGASGNGFQVYRCRTRTPGDARPPRA